MFFSSFCLLSLILCHIWRSGQLKLALTWSFVDWLCSLVLSLLMDMTALWIVSRISSLMKSLRSTNWHLWHQIDTSVPQNKELKWNLGAWHTTSIRLDLEFEPSGADKGQDLEFSEWAWRQGLWEHALVLYYWRLCLNAWSQRLSAGVLHGFGTSINP